MTVLRLRLATLDDQPTLELWDTYQHVIDSGGLDDELDWSVELVRQVDWQEILIAEVDGVPIGVLQVIDPHREESHYWGDIEPNLRAIDIWIGPAEMLGRGHGTEMMHQALDRCFASPEVTAVLIDPLHGNEGAIRFYRRLGFVDDDQHCADPDSLVLRLHRAEWERRRVAAD